MLVGPLTTSSENDKEAETMRRSIRRCIAVAVVSIAISMFVSAVPAAQAAPVNCVHQTHQGACYELVWVHGVEVRMTFPQAGNPLPTIPNAKVQNFYVIAAQTDTPQGDIPSPIHDHTIQAAPGDPGWTPFMHGYFVICSPEGLSSGDCVEVVTDFGFGPLPLAKGVNGEPLTSAETIEAGIDAGLLDVVDTGAVFLGTVSPAR
jgi:hypothetical protein